jgi:type I restriction enzyme, S subunit
MYPILPRRDIDARFLFYAMLGDGFYRYTLLESDRVAMPKINREALGACVFVYPGLERQREVVHFLDHKTAAIDTLIAKKERLIELLQEKRQALITQAVTKGLDPNVPTKQSGIPWIGEVPMHWTIAAIKRAAKRGQKTFTDGDWIESPFITDDGTRLIQTGNVGTGHFKEQGFRYVSNATFLELRCTEVHPGDVLICRLDGPVGRACLAPDLGVRMITSVDNAILKPSPECDARYLVYALSSPKYLDWVQVLCRVGGGFRFRVSRTMLGDIQIPLPPWAEQVRIADLLDENTKRITALEQKLQMHCEKLREYRQALITAAVTGKIDVSNEAA